MKKILSLLTALCAPFLCLPASAATFLDVDPRVAANVAAVSQNDVLTNTVTPNASIMNGTYTNSVFNVSLTAHTDGEGGGSVRIDQLTGLSLTLGGNMTGSTTLIGAGGLQFTASGGGGIEVRAYNSSGVDITDTVGLTNTSLFGSLTSLSQDVYRIIVSNFPITAGDYGGAYNPMTEGQMQTGTINASATLVAAPITGSGIATVTAVPEPAVSFFVCLTGMALLVRRRPTIG